MDINITLTISLAEHVQRIVDKLLTTAPQTTMQSEAVVKAATPMVEEATSTATPVAEEHAKAEAKVIELPVLQGKVSELVQHGKRQQVKDILATYGVSGFSQLNNDERIEFYNKILTL